MTMSSDQYPESSVVGIELTNFATSDIDIDLIAEPDGVSVAQTVHEQSWQPLPASNGGPTPRIMLPRVHCGSESKVAIGIGGSECQQEREGPGHR